MLFQEMTNKWFRLLTFVWIQNLYDSVANYWNYIAVIEFLDLGFLLDILDPLDFFMTFISSFKVVSSEISSVSRQHYLKSMCNLQHL